MTALLGDTIAAVATAPGKGGIGILRLSGPAVAAIAEQMLGKRPAPRQAILHTFRNSQQELIDTGILLYFPGPHSFTGEDVLELQCHGSPIVLDMLLAAMIEKGARLAQPGEFSQRAFLNGKIDLVQAESIADLINATTQQAALSASRSLQGVFSQHIQQLSVKLLELRMYVEAAIDFPEEEIDFLSQGNLVEKIQALIEEIQTIQATAKQGQLLREGLRVAIVGQPNAGKSSLLNCLTQEETAIVTPIAGTTRDLIKETIHLDGLPVHLMDTAGIRTEAQEIEQEGIRRAKEQCKLVDRILLVRDVTHPQISEIESDILRDFGEKVTLVMNKIDLQGVAEGEREGYIYLSAKTKVGLKALRDHLKACTGFGQAEVGQFIARRRHLVALENTLNHCHEAFRQLVDFKAGELVAHELGNAQAALGDIVGKVTTEDLLGNIFSNFCIGK